MKVGGNNNFRETVGEMYRKRENREEIGNLWSMTKKKVIRSFGG